jgi:hypothetical protein
MTLNVVLIILLIGVLLGAMLIGSYFSRALSAGAGGYYPGSFPYVAAPAWRRSPGIGWLPVSALLAILLLAFRPDYEFARPWGKPAVEQEAGAPEIPAPSPPELPNTASPEVPAPVPEAPETLPVLPAYYLQAEAFEAQRNALQSLRRWEHLSSYPVQILYYEGQYAPYKLAIGPFPEGIPAIRRFAKTHRLTDYLIFRSAPDTMPGLDLPGEE